MPIYALYVREHLKYGTAPLFRLLCHNSPPSGQTNVIRGFTHILIISTRKRKAVIATGTKVGLEPDTSCTLDTQVTNVLHVLRTTEATHFETEAGEEFEILTVQADKPDGSLGGKFDVGKIGLDLGKIGFDGGKAGGLGKIGVTVGGQFSAQFGNFNKDIQQGKVFEGKGLIPGGGNLRIGKVAFGGKADIDIKTKLKSVNIPLDENHVKAPKSLLGKLTGKITSILQFGRDFMKSGKKVKIVVGGVAIPSATVAGQVTGGITKITIVADETDDRVNLVVDELDLPAEATNFETEAGEEFEILTVEAVNTDGSLGEEFDIRQIGLDLGKIGFDGGKAGGLGKIAVTVGGQFSAQFASKESFFS
ncbi:hypothetical protein CDAR_376011 [Caerostris darwini]|uniref:Uncharacterized protein n=1 Tax=Caerostris darwini TaxID=1538125 RepID=A0AAV4UIW8_9ARAC|nr:hypothetical protein CDAR_376011 [Caerostris darwini]